ncbi:tryptophan aminotransferase-related protein 2-like [Hibiscus syriacus]|uniref:Tryptophan aminotransferase-related protein 2-like n=1 Tax=Hibiscus syriacus TaxID=106335 RepID=A0A6A3BYV5_HIBSY|nr:tryptophan aminotransferase-related protein 2-like [Hibiscus syriacus]
MKGTLRYLAGTAGPSGHGSKSTAEQVAESCSYSIDTRRLTAIITGIGAETARVMAKRGVRVVIAARDRKKAAKLKEGIQRDINPNAEIIVLEIDLSSLASVKKFCTQFLALGLPLNILMAFFIDRIVDREDDRNSRADRDPRKNHKPFFCDSQLDSLFFIASKLLKSTSQGASSTCYVALSPQAQGMNGKYFADCNESNCSALADDESEAQRLWRQTRALL